MPHQARQHRRWRPAGAASLRPLPPQPWQPSYCPSHLEALRRLGRQLQRALPAAGHLVDDSRGQVPREGLLPGVHLQQAQSGDGKPFRDACITGKGLRGDCCAHPRPMF